MADHWIEVTAGHLERTHRMSVPGGWIYRTMVWGGSEDPEVPGVAMVFVPAYVSNDSVDLRR
jgi:hypothetical protein